MFRVRVKIYCFYPSSEKEEAKKESEDNQNDVKKYTIWNKPLATSIDFIKIESVMEIGF